MKFVIHNEKEINKFIKFILSKEIKVAYRAEFTKIQRKRSLDSNAWMWVIFTHVEQETGNEKYDLYLWMLDRYPTFREVTYRKGDKIITKMVAISSSFFNQQEMCKFISNSSRFFRTEGFEIPKPNSKKALEMFEYYQNRGVL